MLRRSQIECALRPLALSSRARSRDLLPARRLELLCLLKAVVFVLVPVPGWLSSLEVRALGRPARVLESTRWPGALIAVQCDLQAHYHGETCYRDYSACSGCLSACLGGACLGRACLGRACLRGACPGGACPGGARLGGACLGGARLGGACLGRAHVRGARLEGACLGRHSGTQRTRRAAVTGAEPTPDPIATPCRARSKHRLRSHLHVVDYAEVSL